VRSVQETRSGRIRLARAHGRVKKGLVLIGALALMAVASLVVVLMPYTPLKVYSYEARTAYACPGEIVPAFIGYYLDPDARIVRVDVEPDWIAKDVPGVLEGYVQRGAEGSIPGEKLEKGRGVVRSSVLRIAPAQPGEWWVGGEIIVRGRWHGIPKLQRLYPRSEETMTVLPTSDPRCEETR
jgi:hypothetical protein